jgi:hypothetical protein
VVDSEVAGLDDLIEADSAWFVGALVVDVSVQDAAVEDEVETASAFAGVVGQLLNQVYKLAKVLDRAKL